MSMHFEGNPIGPFVGLMLLAMIATWFTLLSKLFKRLRLNHPQKYQQMGQPTLFLRNNIATGLTTLKFIACREHRNWQDPALSKLADLMLGFFVIYLLVFFAVIFFADKLQWAWHGA